MEFAYGNFLSIGPSGDIERYRFQNYAIGESVNSHLFLPFSFSGAVATLQGDNLDASLQFANVPLTRSWAVEALENLWVAKVVTVLWNPSSRAIERELYEYWGCCAAGGWNETGLEVRLNSLLDAVSGNVPGRRLHRYQVGSIPFTAQVSV
jgi:hypothetical protein